MKCPAIVVYQAVEESAPQSMRCAAAMVSTGVAGSYWMATGATPDEAKAKLEAVWERAYSSKAPTGRKKKAESVAADEPVL